MPIEIEAKMRLSDLPALERKLLEVGAERGDHILETNTFFDTPQGELKSGDQGLRIRIERVAGRPSVMTITHKGPRAHGQLKSRSETEACVTDAQAAARLLEALGYVPVLTFEKRRRRWRLDDCNVDLDVLPYLGAFCEIEGPTDEAVLAARGKLGLDETPLIRASYIAMLMSHINEHHLRTRTIRFEDVEEADAMGGGQRTSRRIQAADEHG